jgi:hypothetical protein
MSERPRGDEHVVATAIDSRAHPKVVQHDPGIDRNQIGFEKGEAPPIPGTNVDQSVGDEPLVWNKGGDQRGDRLPDILSRSIQAKTSEIPQERRNLLV